jgi:tripartite-type tricarboxylate transporter receptor subunit TctC
MPARGSIPRRTTMTRVVAAVLAAVLMAAPAVRAQTYPAKNILMIVPVQAGSGADSILRIVTGKMAENLKQQIVVENVAGAAGLLGGERASRAQNDGYTVFGANDGTLTMTPHLYQKVSFDPVNGFEPVSLLAAINWVLITHPSMPVKSVKEFIALGKARPKQIDYSSGGNGSPQHIAMEVFMARTGVRFNHVPYRGATQAALDVISGQVQTMFTATSIVLQFVQNGKVRALGVGSAQRFPGLPEVPTIAEGGLPGFEYSTWAGLYAPKGTSRPVLERLSAEAVKAVRDPAVREKLIGLALEPVGSTAEELARRTREGYERYGKLVRSIGIKPQ